MTENRAGAGEGPDAGTDGKAKDESEQFESSNGLTTQHLADARRTKDAGDETAKRPFNPDDGEDEASTSDEGNEEGLKKDQGPPRQA